MNAARWDASNDPWDMLGWSAVDCSVRQQGLWAVACCRRIWDILPQECHQVLEAVEISLERSDHYAGRVDTEKWGSLFDRTSLWDRNFDPGIRAIWGITGIGLYKSSVGEVADAVARRETGFTGHANWPSEYRAVWRREQAIHANLLREVRSNPYRPLKVFSSWRSSDVLFLAQDIYDTRDFSAAPILADALQDAGCNSDELLKHLRDSHATHVRGCWALDLVLGKS